jgi:hypothetical protein
MSSPVLPRPVLAVAAGLLAWTLASTLAAGPPPGADEPSLELVLARSGAWLRDYERELLNLVGEERYEQMRVAGIDEGFVAGFPRSVKPPPGIKRERLRLDSDFLLYRVEGSESHLGLRDVYAVNGSPVRDREERFRRLLEDRATSVRERWQALATESSRYNLGRVIRNINMPTYALEVVRDEVRHRFRYDRIGARSHLGLEVWEVRYRELSEPTLTHDSHGRPVFMSGTLWIEPGRGQVVYTELETEDPSLRSWIAVRFRPDDKLGCWVPAEMEERYLSLAGEYIECHAGYDNFRRFTVEMETSLGSP